MKAQIITVGDEILSGRQTNKNAQYLAAQLTALGLQVVQQQSVGDSVREIKAALAGALSESNVAVLTGGLGPTPDDVTKDAVCDLLGIEMTVHEESRRKIERFFLHRGEKMPPNNLRQAMLPEGSILVKNDRGLAPGCILQSGDQCIVLLPGVPEEMQGMFEQTVRPFLQKMTGQSTVCKCVNVFGMTESLLAASLSDLMEKRSPAVATYAKKGHTDIVVRASAEDVKDAILKVDLAVEEIERRLGDCVYGVDEPSLQHRVVELLAAQKKTLATAESCTGGLISEKITDIPGASLCFNYGFVTYSEAAKKAMLGVSDKTIREHGVVSAETACQMAVGAMKKAGADMGVSVTGYAGPAGSLGEPVGLVFAAVCTRDTVWVRRLELAPRGDETREQVRRLAGLHAMDMVRRVLQGIPVYQAQRLPVSEIDCNDRAEQSVFYHAAAPASEAEREIESSSARGFFGRLFPLHDDSRAVKVRKTAFLTASAALLVCVLYIVGFFLGILQNRQLYRNLDAMRLKTPGSAVSFPQDYLKEFGLLYAENEEIAGWISIKDTELSYPVMQTSDNAFYLNHNFYGKKDRHGTPFMDCRNDRKTLDVNTVIYGNNMNMDNQMFSVLEKYYRGADALTFYRRHPIISFDTTYEKMQWIIFSVFTCNVDARNGDVFEYYNMLSPKDTDEFNTFLRQVQSRSVLDVPIDVDITDRLLTLSTQYDEFDGQRLVLVARRVRSGEKAEIDVNSVSTKRGTIPDVTSRKTSRPGVSASSARTETAVSRESRPAGYSSRGRETVSYTTWSGRSSSTTSSEKPVESFLDSSSENVSTSSHASSSEKEPSNAPNSSSSSEVSSQEVSSSVSLPSENVEE